jgi:diketogulonate reductase-like aldo/keto reductase
MKTVRLPSGEIVPALGQGTWFVGETASRRSEEIATIQAGIDLGLSLIDTAEMYGEGQSECLLGEALGGRRDKVFLVSKVYPHNASLSNVLTSCERSLKRLKTDRIDLYLLHWRGSIPLGETIRGFEHLQAAGKIRHWGVSNFDPSDMDELIACGGKAVATDQVLYNPLRRGVEWDLLPWCARRSIPVMAYSPLEQGRLFKVRPFVDLAHSLAITPAQLALAWVLRRNGILAVAKAACRRHVEDNARALEFHLTAEVEAAMDQLFPPPASASALEML